MAMKSYRVLFARTSSGTRGVAISQQLRDKVQEHGENLPVIDVGGENFQMREMLHIGAVWRGSFVKLRDDAPNVISPADEEEELDLEDGAHIIEKGYFLYRERANLLVWQANKSSGGLSRAADYLSRLFQCVVTLPHVLNTAELDRVMNGHVRQIDFSYDRPDHLLHRPQVWTRGMFDMMAGIDAAHAKFTLRAPRHGTLAEQVKAMIRQLVTREGEGVSRLKVKLTDESDPIELFTCPLKETVRVELWGRYPRAEHMYQELEEAFRRQRQSIPRVDTD